MSRDYGQEYSDYCALVRKASLAHQVDAVSAMEASARLVRKTLRRSLLMARACSAGCYRVVMRRAASIDASARTCSDSSHEDSTVAPAVTRSAATLRCLPWFPAGGL